MKRATALIAVTLVVACMAVLLTRPQPSTVPLPVPAESLHSERGNAFDLVPVTLESLPTPVADTLVEPRSSQTDEGEIIEGNVRERNGRGLSDVLVSVGIETLVDPDVSPSPRPPDTTITDREGYYRVVGLGGIETVRLTFSHAEYATESLKSIPVGMTDADVVMANMKALVRGRVVDAHSMNPVQDFTIRVWDYETREIAHSASPSGRGMMTGRMRFMGGRRFGGGTPIGEERTESLHSETGEFELLTDHQGRGFVSFIVNADGYAPEQGRADVKVGELTDGVEVRIVPEGVVRGIVVAAADGRPIAGAEVYLFSSPSAHPFYALTNEDGSYAIKALKKGEYALKVTHTDFAPASVDVSVREGQETEVTVEMEQGGAIAGQVRLDGEPFEGAHLEIRPPGRLPGEERKARSDSDGRYRLHGLVSGEHQLRVRVQEQRQRVYVVTEDDRVAEQDFEFESGTGVIEGYVTMNGVPVDGVSLGAMHPSKFPQLEQRWAPTNEQGFYRFEGLAPGEYLVMLEFARGASAW